MFSDRSEKCPFSYIFREPTPTWTIRNDVSPQFEHSIPTSTPIAPGDKIYFRDSDRDREFSRGDSATIINVDPFKITLEHTDGRTQTLDKDEHISGRIDHDYARTTFMSQGMTVDHAILVAPSNSMATSKETMYVGLSRMEQSISVHTDDREKLEKRIERSERDQIATDLETADDKLFKTRDDLSKNDRLSQEREVGDAQAQELEMAKEYGYEERLQKRIDDMERTQELSR